MRRGESRSGAGGEVGGLWARGAVVLDLSMIDLQLTERSVPDLEVFT